MQVLTKVKFSLCQALVFPTTDVKRAKEQWENVSPYVIT